MKRSKVKKGKLYQIFSCIFPVVMSVALIFGVVVSDYNQVKATGVEELLYYTYWDLVNSLFAATGFEMSIDDKVLQDKANRVSGEQMWQAFCYDVKNQIGMTEELGEELADLIFNATAEGIKMSPELFKALGAAFNYSVSASQTYEECVDQYCPVNASYPYRYYNQVNFNGTILNYGFATSKPVTLCYYDVLSSDGQSEAYQSGIAYSTEPFKLYVNSDRIYDSISCNGFYYRCWGTTGYLASGASAFGNISILGGVCLSSFEYGWTFADYINNVLATGGDIASTSLDDIISFTQVAACPAEVPETIPWEVHPSIPDGWRIVDPNEDPEKQPDVLPGVIPFPIIPPGKDPDSTEDPDNTEDPESTQSPEVNPHPGIQINPVTGNEIDPSTGLDIDPETGYLIYPGTGQLINPETGEVIDPETGEVTSIDPVISGGYGDITKLFPFCIPFDLINLVKGMKADKSPPVFHFEFYFESINYNFVVDVDLTDYEKYIQIFRFGMQVFWIIALMFLTVKVSNLFV